MVTEEKEKESCALRALPGVLLGKMWPGEYAFLGLRVSKWLREELTTHLMECIVDLSVPEREDTALESEAISKGLTRFPQSVLRVRVEGSGDSYLADPVVHALLQAAPQGLHSSLVQLDISGTQVNDSQASALWATLEQCSSLSHLRLMSTGGGGFAQAVACVEALGNSSLSHLDLSHPIGMHGLIEERMNGHGQQWQQRLVTLSSQCQQLRHLNVAGCSLRGTSGMLPAMLRLCTGLEHLDLGGNCLEDEEVTAIARELEMRCTSVTHLSLRKNAISDASAQSLAAFLNRCPGMRHLDLGSTRLGCKGTQTLGAGLTVCTALAHLDLSDAGVGEVGAAALAVALQSCSDLTFLDVGHNHQLGQRLFTMQIRTLVEGWCVKLAALRLRKAAITADSVGPLAEALKTMTEMRTLDLSHNDLESEGVQQLASVLTHCPRLSTLSLRCVAAGSEGASALAAALGGCERLSDLDLSWNNVGGKGAAEVLRAMGKGGALRTLNLGYNGMGSEGARALSEALRGCSATALDVSDNGIGAGGVGAIACGLKGCKGLLVLDLSRNQMGPDGVRRLAAEVWGCVGLQELSVNRCAIGDEGAVALAQALERCLTLTKLDASCNGIGVAGAEALCAGAAAMRRLAELDLRNNRLSGDAGKGRLRELVGGCAARVRFCLRD